MAKKKKKTARIDEATTSTGTSSPAVATVTEFPSLETRLSVLEQRFAKLITAIDKSKPVGNI